MHDRWPGLASRLLTSLVLVAAVFVLAGATRAYAQVRNACGCYHDDKGNCQCARPTKCGCPGDCEPANCEAKRQQQSERENQAALKRIAERERKAAAEAKKQTKHGKTARDGKTADKPKTPETTNERREIDDLLAKPPQAGAGEKTQPAGSGK